jgi:hypothetical protein
MKALTHDGLTAVQHAFCRQVARGSSLTDAYRAAYNVRKALPKNVNRKATALFGQPGIRACIEQLVSEAKIQDLDSIGAAYRDTPAYLRQAVERNNLTAAAAFNRQRLQVLAMLKIDVSVSFEQTLSDDELNSRIAGGDGDKVELLRGLLIPPSFDA